MPHSATASSSSAPEPVIRDDVPLAAIPPEQWNALASGQPLLSHAYFSALHASGCASPRTGWHPRFLTAWRGDLLAGAVPMYGKTHSYGEYVFDWAWADAFARHGRAYYPKLLAAIPFTPAMGPRLIAHDAELRRRLLERAKGMLQPASNEAAHHSSLHLNFLTRDEALLCGREGLSLRQGVQFHWHNPGYRDFADFLAAFNHDRRKRINQERRKLQVADVRFERKTGREISAAEWSFFHRCYVNTYRAHRSTPYLTLAFFEQLGSSMPDNLLLVLGYRHHLPICAALDIFGEEALWGRYWGAIDFVSGLHFEACYYQAIEFCIERRLARFEGGAQGLHKLARGLLATPTWSAHAIADADFAPAIAAFCARERSDVAHTLEELEAAAPLRRFASEALNPE